MDQNILKALTDAVNNFNVPRLLRSGLAILVTIVVILVLRSIYMRYRKRIDADNDIDTIRKQHTLRTIYRSVKVVLIIICILVVMQINGINVTSIVMLLSVLAALIAFGIKDMFQDFFAGYIIYTDKYFKVGDAVEFDGRDGIVIMFTIRSTKIELLDDRTVLSVANRNISQIRKLNHLVDIDVPVSYDVDRKKAFEILNGIVEKIRKIEGIEKCELKGTQDFTDSAAVYKIRFFCEPNDRPDIRREVLKTIQDGYSDAGIRIPYQQIDIHEK